MIFAKSNQSWLVHYISFYPCKDFPPRGLVSAMDKSWSAILRRGDPGAEGAAGTTRTTAPDRPNRGRGQARPVLAGGGRRLQIKWKKIPSIISRVLLTESYWMKHLEDTVWNILRTEPVDRHERDLDKYFTDFCRVDRFSFCELCAWTPQNPNLLRRVRQKTHFGYWPLILRNQETCFASHKSNNRKPLPAAQSAKWFLFVSRCALLCYTR